MNPKLMRIGEPGDELVDPSGLRMVLVETPATTEGRRLVMDWFVPPGGRLVAADHYHPDGPEVWEIRSGRAGYRLDGSDHEAEAPHTYSVPGGTSHGHPWNAGDGELQTRQTIASPDPIPELTGGVQGFFETLFAFAQQGKLNEKGEIRPALQNLLTIHDLLMPGTFIAGPPRRLQLAVLGVLSSGARLAGKKPYLRPEFANRSGG